MSDKKGFKVWITNLSVKWKLSIGFGILFLILLISLGTSAGSISQNWKPGRVIFKIHLSSYL